MAEATMEEKMQQLKDLVGKKEVEQAPQDTIDWSKYDLDPKFAHFYPKATLQDNDDDRVWTTPFEQFDSRSMSVKEAGKYLTEMINGPEQWSLAAIMPNGSGLLGIVLRRKIRVELPEPKLLSTAAVVETPTETELGEIEKTAAAWAGGQ